VREIATSIPIVGLAAKKMVSLINKKLFKLAGDLDICATLILVDVTHASLFVAANNNTENHTLVQVIFRTSPGDGVFEGTIDVAQQCPE